MSNIVPISDITLMAEVAAGSKMFGFKNQMEAMAIMLLCQAENLHPATAMRDYHVIQGRPALKADAMLARFQQAGGSVQWKVYTDAEVTGIFSHPQGGSLEVQWTLSHAKHIGLAGKDNWNKYPRAMLRARCISEGIRAVYPGCVVGIYTPEEVQDFAPPKNMGMAERVDTPEVVDLEPVLDGAYRLSVPGLDKPYNSFHTPEEWIEAYCGLVKKITSSPKLSEEEKTSKLKALAEVNTETVDMFKSVHKIKLRSEIILAGGTSNPKPEVSPPAATSEQNEPEF